MLSVCEGNRLIIAILSWIAIFGVVRGHGDPPEIWKTEATRYFTDERAVITADREITGNYPVEIDTLTPDGWTPRQKQSLEFKKGRAEIVPHMEGICRVRSGEMEARFLAITPPDKSDAQRIQETLHLNGWKLAKGDPFTILAMGDSVTATGDYPAILAMLISRATGNSQIRVEKRAYPGRSVDASVRRWRQDIENLRPDLGLIMYGLNDQAAYSPLIAYLEQHAWLAHQLRTGFKADTLFLEPTPHIDILKPDAQGQWPPESTIFRTVTFARALKDLGQRLDVPVVPTFAAIWRNGAATLPDAAWNMAPFYPPNTKEPLATVLESGGKGDMIHPNALGHLQLARAVFERLAGRVEKSDFSLRGKSYWAGDEAMGEVRICNTSGRRLQGTLRVYPFAQRDAFESLEYDLAPGEETPLTFAWPGIRGPGDLHKEAVFRNPGPYVQALVIQDAGSRVSGVRLTWEPDAFFLSKRYIAATPEVEVEARILGEPVKRKLTIPAASQVGRIPLVEKIRCQGKETWMVAEAAYAKYAGAIKMEAAVDGDLAEWNRALWIPVGETVQARTNSGWCDNREKPEECYTRWSFAAGKQGIYMAFRGTANALKDGWTVYFDSRPPADLGTAGPYVWIEGRMNSSQTIALRAGDSCMQRDGMYGCWKADGAGLTGEVFVPYAVLGIDGWPASGDLGASVIWRHVSEQGKVTSLMWAEDGHPWNTLWYGVVRIADSEDALPWRIMVESFSGGEFADAD